MVIVGEAGQGADCSSYLDFRFACADVRKHYSRAKRSA